MKRGSMWTAGRSPIRTQLADNKPFLVALLLAIALGAVIWWGISQRDVKSDSAKRQTAKVALLPDTKPPPPPPPKEEPKKELPKDEPKQAMPDQKQDTPPAPPGEQVKVEGTATDGGASPFVAGTVTRENAVPGGGGTSVVAAPSNAAAHRFFARALKDQLQAQLERELAGSELPRLRLGVRVWLSPVGGIARYEIGEMSAPEFERDIRAALDKASERLRVSKMPTDLPQPIVMQMSVQMLGGG